MLNYKMDVFYKRQYTYSLLAALFSNSLETEHLISLEKNQAFEELIEYSDSDSDSELMDAKEDLIETTEEIMKDKINSSKNLRINFENYFLFCFGEYIPLWETVYLGKDSSLNTEITNELRQFYVKQGYIVEDKTELEDHLSTELAFMSILCQDFIELEDEAIKEEILEAQEKFLENHLCKWVPLMVQVTKKSSICSFYKNLIIFLNVFLQHDLEFVKIQIGRLNHV